MDHQGLENAYYLLTYKGRDDFPGIPVRKNLIKVVSFCYWGKLDQRGGLVKIRGADRLIFAGLSQEE